MFRLSSVDRLGTLSKRQQLSFGFRTHHLF